MADTAIAITAGSGTNVDTRTEGTNGNHRQVIVVGDPATNAGVAPVDATAGLKVDLGADNDIQGVAAENAAASGNPVLSGGRYDSSARTLGNGDVGAIAVSAQGQVITQIANSSGVVQDPVGKAENAASSGGDATVPVSAVYRAAPTAPNGVAGDYTWLVVNDLSELYTRDTHASGPNTATGFDSYTTAVVDLAAGTNDQSIISAPGANKQIWVYGLVMKTNGTTATVVLEDSTPTAKSGTLTLTDSDGFVVNPSGNFEMPWIKCATNTAFRADTGGSGTVDGIVTYAIVDVS